MEGIHWALWIAWVAAQRKERTENIKHGADSEIFQARWHHSVKGGSENWIALGGLVSLKKWGWIGEQGWMSDSLNLN